MLKNRKIWGSDAQTATVLSHLLNIPGQLLEAFDG